MDGVHVPLLMIAVVLSVASLLQWSMTRASATDRLGPNRLVGIRTRATLASDEAWRAGHAAAQPALLVTAVTGLAMVAGLLAWRAVADAATPAFVAACAVAALSVAVLFVRAVVRAGAAAREAHRP